jgi:HSP20 family protein
MTGEVPMGDIQNLLLSSEIGDLGADIARLFEDIDRRVGRPHAVPVGTCTPQVDVVETQSSFEIVVDLPGISAEGTRVLVKDGAVLIVGEKVPPDVPERAHATFHLVERGFGRFARAVELSGAIDASHATAILQSGELRVIVPKIVDRRGREILVPVQDAQR